jgi:hypothetical protein
MCSRIHKQCINLRLKIRDNPKSGSGIVGLNRRQQLLLFGPIAVFGVANKASCATNTAFFALCLTVASLNSTLCSDCPVICIPGNVIQQREPS